MKWRGLIVVLFGLSSTNVASFAQRPPDGESPEIVSPSPLADGCFSSTGVVRFRMLGGRISLDPPRHRKGAESQEVDGVYESVRVTAERGIPSLHYVRHTPEQQLTLSVHQATKLVIESWLPRREQRSRLEQPEFGDIRWTLSSPGGEESFTGSTLLHLREQSSQRFDRHHDAILTCLLHGRSLQQLSRQTTAALMNCLTTTDVPHRDSVLEAVAALDGPTRQQRVAAERQLLQWGTPILPILDTLDRDRLGAEQAARLLQIRRRLRRYRDDTPASLAMQLVNDREHWNHLAPRLTAEEIERANEHLAKSGFEPLPQDGTASSRIAAAP